MNQIQQTYEGTTWGGGTRHWRVNAGTFASGAFRTITLLVRTLIATIAGVVLGLMHFTLGLVALAVGVLAVPALIFAALVGFVLLFNIVARLLEAIGLL